MLHDPESVIIGGDGTYIALSADHLVAVVLGSQSLERWLNDTTTQTQDQVESRLLFIPF